MQTLGFFVAKQTTQQGFTFTELLVCLGVIASLAAFATPGLQRLQERHRVDAARDQLLNDLQASRLRALQRSEPLQVARLRDCAWATSTETDWSCGWEIRLKSNSTVLQASPLHTPLQVTFGKSTPLDVSARGDLGNVGDRWVIRSRNTALGIASVVCLNSTSRLRWQSGESCN
ncbi:prepilin-type N-terminal cleavage/methylation domain-containing protein [Limnohabitans sp.]|uniref:pilus assembly FimT family protein n=1 Tax=Limnohabitans sp. TaxID=1907725 RepID=UPI00286F0D00|nr:prepilin-type N-terminal cleavage/methylation domain-containing protein [Limnohabitans sp.]